MFSQHLERIFESFPGSVVACTRAGKIIRANAATSTFFEVAPDCLHPGKDFEHFLSRYERVHAQPPAQPLEPWLMHLVLGEEAEDPSSTHTALLHLPSGRHLYMCLSRLPLRGKKQQGRGTLYLIRDIMQPYQRLLRVQRVHHAVQTLTAALTHIPQQPAFAFSHEAIVLLSPPVIFLAQQLVEVMSCVLQSHHSHLLALDPSSGQLHYVVGRGLTPEQERYRREINGRYFLVDFLDDTATARLAAQQEVLLTRAQMSLPAGFREEMVSQHLLLLPLQLEQQMVGVLVIGKEDTPYTTEEIEAAKLVVTHAELVIEGLRSMYTQAEKWARDLLQQETHHLINGFLTLAAHELHTQLTAIKGNVQLAQRRLQTLKRQIAEEWERTQNAIERVERPLTVAVQSLRLEERMIKEWIDDVRLQAGSVLIQRERVDLLALLKDIVDEQQRETPERPIVLELPPACKELLLIATPRKVAQVLALFLTTALSYAAPDQAVKVQLIVEESMASISIQTAGSQPQREEHRQAARYGSAAEENVLREELDLRVGVRFYLCQALIERDQGKIRMHHDSHHGMTFWVRLPLEIAPED